jgi:hypothetical protein
MVIDSSSLNCRLSISDPTGVHSLPPVSFGYRHISPSPYYFVTGRLYRIPSDDIESALFSVSLDDRDKDHEAIHPRGGHNYYHGRDMEKSFRRMGWLEKVKGDGDDWKDHYRGLVRLHEGGD